MVHGEKEERGGGRRERVELPDSLMYEAVFSLLDLTNFLMFADVCLLCF